jgi:hypothetical protein
VISACGGEVVLVVVSVGLVELRHFRRDLPMRGELAGISGCDIWVCAFLVYADRRMLHGLARVATRLA